MKTLHQDSPVTARQAFTLMEMLVAIAVVIVLAAIAYPIIHGFQVKKHRTVAAQKMKQLGDALTQYHTTHDGALPAEESETGKNDWNDAAQATADKAWYNALPRQVQQQGLGDYAREHNEAGFYLAGSMFYLPGADYPEGRRMDRPLFAIAYNTKLHRKDPKTGVKPQLTFAIIGAPTRTVAFLEQGLRGEKQPFPKQMGRYDGDDCKASAKQFVIRYSDHGLLTFMDGHTEEIKASRILDPGNGGVRIIWNVSDPSGIFWCADVNEDPN